jgi:uncharacterized membrane protein YidH (DUF202 family)
MRGTSSFLPWIATGLGGALVALGVVYLVLACEELPGFLGGTPGDTSPRTAIGIAVLLVGVATLSIGALANVRRVR